MKQTQIYWKFLFIGLFIHVILVDLDAQHLWPKSDVEWVYSEYGDGGPSNIYHKARQYGDTIINGLRYKFLIDLDTELFEPVMGYIRSEEDRVYFWPKDSLSEFLIYDYSLEVGDTFYNSNWSASPNSEPDYVEIVEIGDAHYGNTVRKQYYFGPHGEGPPWIEGIGSAYSVTRTGYSVPVRGQYFLVCCKIGDSIVVGDIPFCNQFFISSFNNYDIKSSKVLLKAYPNPNNGTFNFLVEPTYSKVIKIEIFDHLGNETNFEIMNKNVIKINNSNSGVYLLRVSLANGQELIQKVLVISG